MCGICDIVNVSARSLFTEEEIDAFILNVYSGKINPVELDNFIYSKSAAQLEDGIYKGYGMTLDSVAYGSEDYLMLKDLQKNAYAFSAAKQYQTVRAINELDKFGSYAEFKKEASKIFDTFYGTYQTAEYNSSIAQSRSASYWKELQDSSDIYGCLMYQTVEDGRVRIDHASMNKIVKPLKDKFWDKYFPPNGWNCRCTALPVMCDEHTPTDISGMKFKDVPKIFRFNAGKDRIVFSEKHPYFKVAKDDKAAALSNFGLPLP